MSKQDQNKEQIAALIESTGHAGVPRPAGFTAYFAFGSNLCPDQMVKRCPSAIPGPLGCLVGYSLEFAGSSRTWGGCGVAMIKPNQGEGVFGRIYWLNVADLQKLDRYEGHPWAYERTKYQIAAIDEEGYLTDDPAVHVYAWAYTKPAETETRPPSKAYVDRIAGGMKRHGFPWGGDATASLGRAINRALDDQTDRVVGALQIDEQDKPIHESDPQLPIPF